MKIAVLKERVENEKRVAVSPETVRKLVELGFKVTIEKNAGLAANIFDHAYEDAGAKITDVALELLSDANIVLKVQATHPKESGEFNELKLLPEKSLIIGLLSPYSNKDLMNEYASKQYSSFAMEFIPRITRAQSMDVLSSQSNLAGYRSVIEASNEFDRIFPMFMTAAGSISPAKVLVIGAGVAGLQAIATSKRLGAVVSAFDVRSAAKEQVESLGAKFIEVSSSENLETTSGYAKAASEEYKQKQQDLIKEACKKHDIIICTAMIPGKTAPVLLTKEMVEIMKPGSVIVDLATASGGNCALSKKDEVIKTPNGVKIIGYSNMASRVAHDASILYAKNLFNFVQLLYDKEKKELKIDLEDEIVRESLITHEGKIVNTLIKESYNNG